MREYKEPTIKESDNCIDEQIYQHPAFAMLRFNRAHCGGEELFGSSITHNEIILMELSHADMSRMLNQDWYHSTNLIARVEMSLSQFTEAITSFGNDGTPVTLRYTEKDGHIPGCHFENKRTQITEEFKDKLKDTSEDARNLLKEMTEAFKTSSLPKKKREELLKKMNAVVTNMDSNSAFVFNQFNEQVDKTITEAKGEVEAFIGNRLNRIAMDAIASQKEDNKFLSINMFETDSEKEKNNE